MRKARSDEHDPAGARLAAFGLLLIALAVGIRLLGGDGGSGYLSGAPFHVPWFVIAAAFAATEVGAVHVESRGEAHAITFSELPYVAGLLLSTPNDLVIARIAAGVVILGLVRRQSSHKLLFNLAMFAAEATVASSVYRYLIVGDDPVGVSGWPALLGALLIAHLMCTMAVTAGITIFSGWPGRSMVKQVAVFGTIVCLANAAAGLAFVSSVWERSYTGLLSLTVPAALFVLYRSWTSLTERHRNLETLHGFTRELGRSSDLQDLEYSVVAGARSILRGEQGSLMLPPIREGAPATRVLVTGDQVIRSNISPIELAADLGILLPDGVARLFEAGQPLPGWLAEIGVRDAAVVPLVADGVTTGAMMVANRLTEVSEFVEDDLRVFETLANHANVALENGRLVAHLQFEAQEQAYLALHDPVTGLPNRSSLLDLLDTAIRRSKLSEERCALVFVDLDTFKEVNDTLGTATGDRLLIDVRRRVEGRLPENATLTRLTGDQFAILVTGVTDLEPVMALAESIHAEFESPFTADAVSLVLGASLGIAVYPDHAATPDLLLQRADAATYSARVAGSGIEVYVAETDPYAPRRLALAADLREALERDEVEVYVQPKVQLADGLVIGGEALVRWTHPRLGFLSPDQFIPAAEHTGVIKALTLYVVRDALAQCRSWRDAGMDLTISVNLSARNLFDSHLVEDIRDAISTAGVPASSLTLELTESTVMGGSRRSMAVLEGLQDLGVGLSVDDFGTGYSSLSHLRQLPVTELKVDKSFVSTMTTTDHDAVIVRALIDLGRSLGLNTVAEGVESTDAWDMLKEFGCDEAQGYLLSRPIPAEQFTAWLERQHVRRLVGDRTVLPFVRDRRVAGDDQ
ncbi:MAG: putative bifunctional diguanylate cyclase/phosphodiesterase [Microthrixaceae bacterium]